MSINAVMDKSIIVSSTRSLTPGREEKGMDVPMDYLQQSESEADSLKEQQEHIFALLIGINNYVSPDIKNLRGAVADAHAMRNFLIEIVGIPETHIQELYNDKATSENIKAAVLSFVEDSRIQLGDSILIYYAGHGSEVRKPQAIQMSSNVQMLIPHDFNPKATESGAGQGILDYVFSDWLARVAKVVGNHITVILDSCHSSSGTRALDEEAVRSISLSDEYSLPPLSESVATLPDKDSERGSKAAFGFARSGLESHVLLAACREDETAKERNGRGLFTGALLTALQHLGPHNVTYADLIDSLPDIGREQNPHCEGVHNDRFFLSSRAAERQAAVYELANVSIAGTECITIRAGDAIGITTGAEFAVYAKRPPTLAPPLGTLIVSKVQASMSTLVPKPGLPSFSIPRTAYALQIRSGPRTEFVNVAIQPGFLRDYNLSDITSKIPQGIRIVQDRQYADLVLNKNHTGIGFEILDPACADYGLHQTGRSRSDALDDVITLLKVIDHYYFHLRRSSKHQFLASSLNVECFEVVSPYSVSENNLNLNGLITTVAGGFDEDEGSIPSYGFRITNNSQIPLFVAAFFFNGSDLSIKPYYKPPIPHSAPRARPCLSPGGSLTIGYGASGAIAREYYVEDGYDVDVGFLKVFASTGYVDYASVQQTSPFNPNECETDRALSKTNRFFQPMWDSKVITIVQQKRAL